MIFRPNPSSGVPIYLQLMEQVKHSIETGALRPGDQLPGIRPLAEELVINPNTVAKAYRELEHEGILELRHGAGAFVSGAAREKKLTERLRPTKFLGAAGLRSRRVGHERAGALPELDDPLALELAIGFRHCVGIDHELLRERPDARQLIPGS